MEKMVFKQLFVITASLFACCLLQAESFSIVEDDFCYDVDDEICCILDNESEKFHPIDEGVGSSSNPSPTDHIGTGRLADTLYEMATGEPNNTGFSLEGLWILDENRLLTGGVEDGKKNTINNLIQFELLFDPSKVSQWKGALFSVQVLRLDAGPTNSDAGLVQGFEGLVSSEPFNRTQFYAWWYRQELLDGSLIFRVGKSTPNADFNVVNRLFPINDKRISPVASGVIYGQIFTQGTLAAYMPNYYNSALGASVFYFPVKNFYVAAGGYDGNKARGIETGMTGPEFNGYYFLVSESGLSWSDAELPGRIAVGVWRQTGKLTFETDSTIIQQQGVKGIYCYGSQRLWWKNKGIANSGIVTYFQLGINNTKTFPINKYLGWGITTYGLVPGRLKDSCGFGLGLAGLNKNRVPRSTEWMFQAYYQCCLFSTVYLEPVISYIPAPGTSLVLPPTWAATLRLIARF